MKKTNLFSRHWRLNHLYKIVNKEGKTVTFKLNQTQQKIFDEQKRLRDEKKPERIMVLKARQLGISTYKIIEGLDRALFYPNQTSIISAHKQDKLQDLFQKAKFAYENLPAIIKTPAGDWIKPSAKFDNRNELFFSGNNSRIKVTIDTRSGTPTSLHLTELAFVKQDEEMWAGTMPSIPKNAPVTIETTANGIGNLFHRLWTSNSSFSKMFFPWFDDPDYSLPTDDEVILPSELEHLNNLNLTNGQKAWYLAQYNNLGRGVLQEYPSTPEEAFLTTGDPVFNKTKISSLPILNYKEDEIIKDLRIYAEPPKRKNGDPDYSYYGVDTAGGGINGDKSAIVVRDFNKNLLAAYNGHREPDNLCQVIDRLYTLGYQGVIGIEVNNTGIGTLVEAKKYYWHNYIYHEKTIDKITNKETRSYGWRTSAKTRPVMIADMQSFLRNDILTEIDEREKSEMMTFVYNENNKPDALS
ncbi:MAG TPA: hypothetical protein PLQ36_03085, partial [Candidatus Gracilibacteria bacterium]|nr:hypothetical protein [Candidatus Gracilibacteria bacterium]